MMKPVPPILFLEVRRSRTAPFWRHPGLIIEEGVVEEPIRHVEDENEQEGEEEEEGDDGVGEKERARMGAMEDKEEHDEHEVMFAAEIGKSVDQRLEELVQLFRDFADGADYQRQFRDARMLQTIERKFARGIRLAGQCLGKEQKRTMPATWEQSALGAE